MPMCYKLLTDEERIRYHRQLILPEVGESGQERLRRSRALVCGLGGLGSPAAYYLAAAGVGTIGLIDGDNVEVSNLQRQILHSTADIGKAKADSAGERLQALNPHVYLITYKEYLMADNMDSLIKDYDVILDGLDNFPARLLLNRACLSAEKVFVHGGVQGYTGQIMLVLPGQGPCLQCLLPQPGATDAEAGADTAARENSGETIGVLGALPGVIGTLQAVEALKYLLGIGNLPIGRMTSYNALTSRFVTIKVERDPACKACGKQHL